MAEYTPPLTTCAVCGGDGVIDGNICTTCLGDGALPLQSKDRLSLKLTVSRLDSIISEQASLRSDLTSALAAIWNKVKDLP